MISEYVNFLCTAKDGETIKNTTMMLRDGFDEELVSIDVI